MLANRAVVKAPTTIKTPTELCVMALDWAIAHLTTSYKRLDWSDDITNSANRSAKLNTN